MASGEWRVASGEWRVASGEWRVASGEWRVGRAEGFLTSRTAFGMTGFFVGEPLDSPFADSELCHGVGFLRG